MLPRTDPVVLARQFIRATAHLDIRLSEIAAASGISATALQHAFTKQIGITPLGYLKSIRLARAHEEIEAQATAAHPLTASIVNEIARRWHFSHPSRFTTAYLETFGRLPTEESVFVRLDRTA
jgi:AraC-like DNA-binding protein